MSKRKTSGFVKILAWIILILFVFAAVGLVLRFTNGGTTGFKTFYVQVDKTMYTDNGEIELSYHDPVRFETKYVFASNKASEHKGYHVKIVPNVENNFEFKVNEKLYSFSAEKDFTAAFDIEQDETGFTITNNGLSVKSILKSIYVGQEVTVPDLDTMVSNCFNLVVSAYNNSQSIVFGLRFSVLPADMILSEDGIIL